MLGYIVYLSASVFVESVEYEISVKEFFSSIEELKSESYDRLPVADNFRFSVINNETGLHVVGNDIPKSVFDKGLRLVAKAKLGAAQIKLVSLKKS